MPLGSSSRGADVHRWWWKASPLKSPWSKEVFRNVIHARLESPSSAEARDHYRYLIKSWEVNDRQSVFVFYVVMIGGLSWIIRLRVALREIACAFWAVCLWCCYTRLLILLGADINTHAGYVCKMSKSSWTQSRLYCGVYVLSNKIYTNEALTLTVNMFHTTVFCLLIA